MQVLERPAVRVEWSAVEAVLESAAAADLPMEVLPAAAREAKESAPRLVEESAVMLAAAVLPLAVLAGDEDLLPVQAVMKEWAQQAEAASDAVVAAVEEPDSDEAAEWLARCPASKVPASVQWEAVAAACQVWAVERPAACRAAAA